MATNITPDNSTYEYNAPQFLNFITPIMDYDGADKFFDAITDSTESNGVVPENLDIIGDDSITASTPSSPKPNNTEDRNDCEVEHNVNNAETDVSSRSNLSNRSTIPACDLLNIISKTVKDAEESARAKGIKRTYAPAIEHIEDVNGEDSYKIVAVEVGHRGVPVLKKGKNYTVVQPFSFEERNKRLQQEKEEKIQKILEEEKKMHEFHANPPPSFIQPPSRTQISTCTNPKSPKFRIEERIQERNKTKPKEDNSQHPFKAQPASVLQKAPFIPKKAECPLTDVTGFHLNTEERARKREEFNLIIKAKEAELESLRSQRKLEEEKKLEYEIRQLRKEVVHKANPVPVFKPMLPVISNIPLTEPKSPNFASKKLIHKHKHKH